MREKLSSTEIYRTVSSPKMAPRGDLHAVEFYAKTSGNDKISTVHSRGSSLSQERKEEQHEYEDVLNMIGFGKTQWIVLFTAGLLLMMVINETMGMSIITIASQCDFATSSVDKAVMSAACFIGILCSSYFWGYLSDTIGRRTVLIISTFTGNVFSFISIFIPNYWVYVLFRFVVGIFIAGASSTTYAYLGEFFTTRHRPVVINFASMFVGFSNAYVPAVAWLVLTMNWSFEITDSFAFRPWRLLSILYLLPGFVATLILLKLPESPRIYLSLQKEKEALESVDWICRRNTGHTLSEIEVYKLKFEAKMDNDNILLTTKTPSSAMKKMWQETRPLFQRPHIMNFLISCVVMCGLFLCNSGMGLWYPEIQNRLGVNTGENHLTVCQVIDISMHQQIQNSTETTCDDTITTKSYIDSITYGLSYIVGYVILGMVINPLGRKLVIIGALCISGFCGVALYWLLAPIAIVVSFCVYLMLPGLCISVLSGAVVDLVPTHLRGKAVCICLMLGRSGSIIGSNIIGVLLESQCSLTFGVISGFVFVCAALTLLLPI